MSITLNGTTGITTPASTVGGSAVLTTASTVATSALPAGSVLQVVSATKTDKFTHGTTTFTTVTGLTASITPTNSSSKFLVLINVQGSQDVNVNDCFVAIYRDSTPIGVGDTDESRTNNSFMLMTSATGWTASGSMTTLDSPNTTSPITYSVKVAARNSGTIFINRSEDNGNYTSGAGSPASSITVMEIAG
jgi:hypothetical protein